MANNYEGKYKGFMFMPGWRDMLEGLQDEVGPELAKEALWQLMLVGTTDWGSDEEIVVDTDKKIIKGFVEGCVLPVIRSSTKTYNTNRENGKKGGRPRKQVDIDAAIKMHDEEGKTWKEVAKILDIGTDTLKTLRDEKKAEKPKNLETEKVEKPKNSEDKIDSEIKNPKNLKTEKGIEIAGFKF